MDLDHLLMKAKEGVGGYANVIGFELHFLAEGGHRSWYNLSVGSTGPAPSTYWLSQ
jgi:hypothetical protein